MCLGIPGKILEINEVRSTRLAVVDFGGVTKAVCLADVPEVAVGDHTIVHAGFAITRLDEDPALEPLRIFREIGMLDDELGASNEGRLATFGPAESDEELLEAMRLSSEGRESVVIGRVVEEHPGIVVARTGLGGTRVVDRPMGEQLPRIC